MNFATLFVHQVNPKIMHNTKVLCPVWKFEIPPKAPLISIRWDSWMSLIRSMRSGIFDTFQSPNSLNLWFIDSQLLFFQSGGIMWFDWLGRKIFSFNVGSNLSWRYLPPTCPKFCKTSHSCSKYEIRESEYISPVLSNIENNYSVTNFFRDIM
jgi:hypothetical protein